MGQKKSGKGKANLLFVIIQTSLAGSEQVVLDLAKHIDRSKFNVHVAYFIGGTLQNAFREACEGVFHVSKKPHVDIRAAFQLAKIIRDNDIHIVNAHHYMCFFYSYLACKLIGNTRLVYTEHSVPEVERISRMHKFICNLFMYHTDAVVGVSKGIAEAFSKKFSAHSDKIVSILNGVNIQRFALDIDRERAREKLGLGPEHLAIGMVANFRLVKNHVCLIRAFQNISEMYPHVRLVFVGKGYTDDKENSEEDVRRLIRELCLDGKVVMAGYRENIPELLQGFDVFCLPSLSEGLPISVLEAMAAKVPVVASNVQGIDEVIVSGDTGLLFNSNDDKDLAKALESLIREDSLRKNLSQRAFTFVSRVHGIKQWVSTYEQLFQSICSEGGPNISYPSDRANDILDPV